MVVPSSANIQIGDVSDLGDRAHAVNRDRALKIVQCQRGLTRCGWSFVRKPCGSPELEIDITGEKLVHAPD